jgi:sporulation protein YlmC with PRC-barrel domain
MSTGTRVFVARVAGLAVFDPNGDQVGRVRDVVAALRIGRDAPRVLGLVVEIQARRRIFVPIGRVNTIDPDAVVLTSGTVSLRRFDKRAGETLVLAELLDRSVSLLASGESVSVLDIAMEQQRTGDWLLTRVAVRKGGGTGLRTRRRGEVVQVPWDQVSGFSLPEDGQGAANLLAVFEKLRPPTWPGDARPVRQAAARDRRGARRRAAGRRPRGDERGRAGRAARRAGGRAGRGRARGDGPGRRRRPAGRAAAEDAERLLELMEPDEAGPVRSLLAYSDDTAGG